MSQQVTQPRKSRAPFALLAALLLFGACAPKENSSSPLEFAPEEAAEAGTATIDESIVRVALTEILAGPVEVSFEVNLTEEAAAQLEDDTRRDISFMREDMRILVDAAGNWEAAIMFGDGTTRSVDATAYFAKESRPSAATVWEAEAYVPGSGLDKKMYLRAAHEYALGWVGIGSPLGASGVAEDTSWWEYCVSDGTLSGAGSTWTLTCPAPPGFDSVKLNAASAAFRTIAEVVLRDAVNVAKAEGRPVGPESVATAVSTQLDAGTEGLSYDPKTSELTLSFGEDRPTCAGVVVFDPTGISPPKIREQASSSQTPCGSVPAAEALRIAVALEGSSVVSLTLTNPFGEGSTAIVSYDRDLPEGFTVQAPVNSMDREVVDLRTFAEQVVRNAAVVAVSSTGGAGPESTVDITLEHINDAILGMDLEGYEFKKTEASVVIQALDGPDAGCSVAISPARVSVADDDNVYTMIGYIKC